jgi:hypothetical protein
LLLTRARALPGRDWASCWTSTRRRCGTGSRPSSTQHVRVAGLPPILAMMQPSCAMSQPPVGVTPGSTSPGA